MIGVVTRKVRIEKDVKNQNFPEGVPQTVGPTIVAVNPYPVSRSDRNNLTRVYCTNKIEAETPLESPG
jgi:hypothetical protein